MDKRVQKRQGDIFFIPVTELPRGIKRGRKDNIIAYGEITGHGHQVIIPEDSGFKIKDLFFDVAGRTYIEVPTDLPFPLVIKHGLVKELPKIEIPGDKPHKPLILEPGIWRVVRQREHQENSPRTVAD
jgi:hypothetical protein